LLQASKEAEIGNNQNTVKSSHLSHVMIMQTTKPHEVCIRNLRGRVEKADPGLKSPKLASVFQSFI